MPTSFDHFVGIWWFGWYCRQMEVAGRGMLQVYGTKKGVCVVFKWENFMCDGLVKNEHWVGYVFLSVSRPEDWWQSDMACKCLQIYGSLYPNTISIEISIFFLFNIQLLGRNCKKYNPPCSLSIHPLCYVVSFQCQPARPTPEQKKKTKQTNHNRLANRAHYA